MFLEINKIFTAGKKTSPGPDRMHYTMLAHLFPKALQALLRFWETGKMPNEWKKAIIILFFKTGKPPSLSRSYRLLALASCVAKSYESIINVRLTYIFETKKLLDNCHVGDKKVCYTWLTRRKSAKCLLTQATLPSFFSLVKSIYDTTLRFWNFERLGRLMGKILSCLSCFMSN